MKTPKITKYVCSNKWCFFFRIISKFIPDKGENVFDISTHIAFDKTGTQGTLASDADKQELKDNFVNIKNDIPKVPSHIKGIK